MLNETLKKFLNDSSAILLEGGRRSIILSSNSSESIITGGDSTSSSTTGGGGDEEDDTTASINISENEWNTIRPFIDEEELMGLEPKARLHIIVSALACNLDHQWNGSGNKRLVGEGNYSDLGEEYHQDHHPQQLYCPRTFDGWSCWNETPAGETAYAPCPWFVTGFEAGRIAHKQCLKDGTWFKHPLTNSTWSNYTTCVDLEALQVYQNVNTVYEVGYLISVCALILSLFIFCRFRSLSCTRVTIHKHLFASFIINNSLWLVWYRTVVSSSITVNELNQIYCAVIHILTQYFMMANYFWMFCEGFYLHTLLVYAFTRAESKLLRWFFVFGWLGPSIPIGMYTAFRGADSDPMEGKECWIHDSKWSLLISGPVCICLLVSLAFLINIVRVLVMKLNASRRVTRTVHGRNNSGRLLGPGGGGGDHNQRNGGVPRRESCAPGGGNDSASSLRKASRATLILIPLLGLHYFIIPFRPDNESNKWAAVTYEYVAAFTSSLQGLAVSLIFCFCNGEVLAVLRRHICPSYSSPSTHHHNDSTYNDYSCGGKLLGNLASRLFRRNRNGNAGRSGDGGQRQSTFSCSPTTTIMNINTSSAPPSPSRRSSTLVPLQQQEQRHENDQATTTTVVMTLDDDDNDGDNDQNNRLISRTVSPRRRYGGGGSGSNRSSSSNPHHRPDSYGKGESDGDEDDGNDVQLVVIASPSNNRPGGTRSVVIVSGKENSDHHLGVNEAAV